MLPNPAGGCGEIGIHAGFRCLWALRPWRFESSQPHTRNAPPKRGVSRFLALAAERLRLLDAGRLRAALERLALRQRLRLLDADRLLGPAQLAALGQRGRELGRLLAGGPLGLRERRTGDDLGDLARGRRRRRRARAGRRRRRDGRGRRRVNAATATGVTAAAGA